MSDSGLISQALDMVKEDDNNCEDSKEVLIKLPHPIPFKKRKAKGDPFMSRGGGDFTTHIFLVNPREDVIAKIMSFTENGSRGICVLSANGAVCNFKIRPFGLKAVETYKVAYELISLSSSMVITESGEAKNETGGWRISFGGVNGFFHGGCLVDGLIAASPVQVVIGIFSPIAEPSKKRKLKSKVVTPTIPKPSAFTSNSQS